MRKQEYKNKLYLPTRQEANIEKNRIKNIILNEAPDLCKVSFSTGFNICFEWFNNKIKQNGN